ncbi:MAG: hypothetical protein LBB22_05550 [Treponema sp.]|jgi:hypothetical protein|nr:hypothetical protein [Treponema sp.]
MNYFYESRSSQLKKTKKSTGWMTGFVVVAMVTAFSFMLTACEDMASGLDVILPIITGNGETPVSNGVTVTPGLVELGKGVNQKFTAAITGGGKQTVKWRVDGNSDANTKIDETGLLTVGPDESAKTLVIKAVLSSNITKFGSAIALILGNDRPVENGISVAPKIITVNKNTRQTFTASLSVTGDPEENVEWTVEGSSFESGTTITGGVLIVGKNESAKSLTVKASKNGKYGTAMVYIKENGGAPSDGGPYPSNLGLAVIPIEVTMDKGDTSSPFTASASKNGIAIEDVNWSLYGVTDSEIANASVTIGLNETAWKIAVKAVANVTGTNETVSGNALIYVRGNEKPSTPVNNGVLIKPDNAAIDAGYKKKFTAEDSISGGAAVVTWRVIGGKTGTAVSVDGELTVASDEKAVYLTLRAEMKDGSGRYGSVPVKVSKNGGKDDGPVTSCGITVEPDKITLAKGHRKQFTAKDSDGNVMNDVNWSLEPIDVSMHGSTMISESGEIRIATDEKLTVITVFARDKNNSDVYGTAIVNIGDEEETGACITGVKVTPESVDMNRGETRKFSAVVLGNSDPPQSVTWSVEKSPDGVSIDCATGVLTVSTTASTGSLIVRATSTNDTTKSGTATVNVVDVCIIVDVRVTSPLEQIAQGGQMQFTAIVGKPGKPSTNVDWSVDCPSPGVVIDENGFLSVPVTTAINTRITVRATSWLSPLISGTKTITVSAGIENVMITPASKNVARGDRLQLNATVYGFNGAKPDQRVVWSIVETGVAAGTYIDTSGMLYVSANEMLSTLTVKAASAIDPSKFGTAVISVQILHIRFKKLTNTLPVLDTIVLTGISDDNVMLLGAYYGRVIRSTDGGENWHRVDCKFDEANNAYIGVDAMAYGNGVFVASATDMNPWYKAEVPIGIVYSTDKGTTWNRAALPDNFRVHRLRYLNNKFFAVGNNGKISYSSDGKNWTMISSSKFPSDGLIRDITYGNNMYIAVGCSLNGDPKISYSSNLTTWYSLAVDNSVFPTYNPRKSGDMKASLSLIAFSGNKFYVWNNEGVLGSSASGTGNWGSENWQRDYPPELQGIPFGNPFDIAAKNSETLFITGGMNQFGNWFAYTDKSSLSGWKFIRPDTSNYLRYVAVAYCKGRVIISDVGGNVYGTY